jgi:hypothetical protein
MDVRGKAPVYIPPAYPVAAAVLPTTLPKERRIGLKVRIAFMLTLFFVVLQLHPVMNTLNTLYATLFMRPDELANEYGCSTGKGTAFMAVVFFVLALIWLRPL